MLIPPENKSVRTEYVRRAREVRRAGVNQLAADWQEECGSNIGGGPLDARRDHGTGVMRDIQFPAQKWRFHGVSVTVNKSM